MAARLPGTYRSAWVSRGVDINPFGAWSVPSGGLLAKVLSEEGYCLPSYWRRRIDLSPPPPPLPPASVVVSEALVGGSSRQYCVCGGEICGEGAGVDVRVHVLCSFVPVYSGTSLHLWVCVLNELARAVRIDNAEAVV